MLRLPRSRVLLMAVLITACTAANETTPGPSADALSAGVADSVRSAMSGMLRAIGARDSAQVMRYIAADTGMRLIEGAVMTRADLTGMIGGFYRGLRSLESSLEGPLHVVALGPDAAVASGRYRDVFTDTTGKRTEAKGVGTWVWMRGAGGWQIIHQHATPDPAGLQ